MSNLLKEICDNSGLKVSDILGNINSASVSYKVYHIPKRTGGYREIAQPSAFVKKVQRVIVSAFLSKFNSSDVSYAYVEGKSIVDNANNHKEKNWLLKIDFKNFFPSIKPRDLFCFLEAEKVELNEFDKKILSAYLFRKKKGNLELSIGAPSSPLVSNLVMKDIDGLIKSYCSKNSIIYSRYADDLTFSSDCREQLVSLSKKIPFILGEAKYPVLKINNKKTALVGRGRSKRVTGVVITHENKLSVGRYCRKKIRALLHLYVVGTLKKKDIPYLHGLISHVRNVEPTYFDKLQKKYNDNVFQRLALEAYNIAKAERLKQYE